MPSIKKPDVKYALIQSKVATHLVNSKAHYVHFNASQLRRVVGYSQTENSPCSTIAPPCADSALCLVIEENSLNPGCCGLHAISRTFEERIGDTLAVVKQTSEDIGRMNNNALEERLGTLLNRSCKKRSILIPSVT